MKLSEYIKEFGDKQVDVDKLSEFIIEDKIWLPKDGERYYFVDVAGKVSWYFNDNIVDKSIFDCQQVYRTKAEAEFARDKAIFLEFMRKEFLRNSDVIDWGDKDQTKYYMLWNCLDRETIIKHSHVLIRNDFYTTDENWLYDFMNDYYERIKKYYFEVVE